MTDENKISYWVEMAQYDLVSARVMLNGGRYLYVGFMCHQVIEKILKACFVHLEDKTPPRTHNLTRLAKLAGIYSELSESHKDFLDILEPLNVQARYPTYKEKLLQSLDNDRSNEILRETEGLLQWIMKKLP